MNSSQMPELPRWRIGCARPSQRLKSPITLTRSALGAHTAKTTPRGAAVVDDVRAELLIRAEVVALVEKLQVQVAQDGQEAVRVATLAGLAFFVHDAYLVGEDLRHAGELRLEEIGPFQSLEGLRGAIGGDGPRLLGMREKGADGDQPRALHLHDVCTEHLERIVMIGVENSIELVLGDGRLHGDAPGRRRTQHHYSTGFSGNQSGLWLRTRSFWRRRQDHSGAAALPGDILASRHPLLR